MSAFSLDTLMAMDLKERLHELAGRDRELYQTLSTHGARFHSVNDPIEAEIYRIRCDLYCVLADGADAEQAFQEYYERARAACEQFNAKQDATLSKRRSWHNTDTGHFSPEEAWQRLRHAISMYKSLKEQL